MKKSSAVLKTDTICYEYITIYSAATKKVGGICLGLITTKGEFKEDVCQ
jgi:hypothetical protein